jgi:hypothetical protein
MYQESMSVEVSTYSLNTTNQSFVMKEDKTMGKYMALWEIETSRTPEDPKAKKAQWLKFDEIVAKQLKEGVIKDWGLFPGDAGGYVIFEGSSVNLHTLLGMWSPYVKFKTREAMTIEQVIKATKALPE